MIRLEILGKILYTSLYNVTICSIVLLLTGIVGCLVFTQLYQVIDRQAQNIGEQLLRTRRKRARGNSL
jgi:hypothetical protein